MEITNHPPALDRTMQGVLAEMDHENALLSMLAEEKRGTAVRSISQMARQIRSNTVERNRWLFPEGDQIVVNWHFDGKDYEVPLDVVHHDLVELEDGSRVPGMFLQWHYALPLSMSADSKQALMVCSDGLAAGTYYVTCQNTHRPTPGTSIHFTLKKDVPAGGRLSGFDYLTSYGASYNVNVKSWASQTSVSPMEMVPIYEGADGTFLGIFDRYTPSEDGLNCLECMEDGNVFWKKMQVRRWLNALDTNWWTPIYDFELRPEYCDYPGFMSGFDEEFLAAIKPVKVQTLTTLDGDYDVTYDRFFLPSMEQLYIKVIPHNSAVMLTVTFPPSASCRNLDLHPVNLRFLQLQLTKNSLVIIPPHLCGVALNQALLVLREHTGNTGKIDFGEMCQSRPTIQ